MSKRLVLIGTAVMTTVLALVVLWQFRSVVIYVLISLMLAATVRPIAQSATRRKFVPRLLLTLLYVVSLGVFVFFTFLLGQ